MQSIEEQNRLMQGNNKQLKDELLETRKKYNEAQDNYMKTVASKFEQERQHEVVLERLNVEVSNKRKEFDVLREKFAPQDIDYIRIKVQEELEIPHKQRILAMEAEVEKHKEESFKSMRELERCKADYEAYSALQQRNAAAAAEDYNLGLIEMQGYVADMKNRNFDAEKDDALRTQRVKLGEMEQTCKSLRAEIAAVRTDRDETFYNTEQYRTHADEELTSLRARFAINETDKMALEKRVSLLASELDTKESQMRSLKQELEYSKDQMDSLKGQLMDAQTSVDRVREEGMVGIEQQRLRFETERSEQGAHIDSLQAKLLSREEQIRRTQREVVEGQVRMEGVEGAVRNTYAAQLVESRQRADTAMLNFTDTRDKMSMEMANLRQTIDARVNENENFKSEMTRLQREKGLLYDKLQGLEGRLVAEKSKYAVLKRDLSTKVAVAEEHEARLKSELHSQTQRFNEAAAHDEEQMKEIRRLQQRLSEHEAETEKRVNQATKGLREQQENVERVCLMKLEEGKRSARDAVNKERRKADAYKEKALESHARNKALLSKFTGADIDATAHFR
jgi:predicted  nucleic acid-binding Zn-ribbon protein